MSSYKIEMNTSNTDKRSGDRAVKIRVNFINFY